jgi:hypothetical protein
MTRLAPHIIKPYECPGCWDYVRAWLVKWLARLALIGLGFVAGCAYHAMVIGK